jgi:hypothetical protein
LWVRKRWNLWREKRYKIFCLSWHLSFLGFLSLFDLPPSLTVKKTQPKISQSESEVLCRVFSSSCSGHDMELLNPTRRQNMDSHLENPPI